MTDRDKSILECSEKMCEYCCNFDKEHIGMDCTALCKLTMTLAYAEDYGGNCMFYNVPKEQIIVPPCKVGDTMYYLTTVDTEKELNVTDIFCGTVQTVGFDGKNIWVSVKYKNGLYYSHTAKDFGKTVFLTKEEAEKALKEREKQK